MFKNSKKNAVIVSLGAAVACAVCLVPLTVPLVVGAVGVGSVDTGYWAIGGVLVLVAGVLVVLMMGWFKSSGRECCGSKWLCGFGLCQ